MPKEGELNFVLAGRMADNQKKHGQHQGKVHAMEPAWATSTKYADAACPDASHVECCLLHTGICGCRAMCEGEISIDSERHFSMP